MYNAKRRNRFIALAMVVSVIMLAWGLYELTLPLDLQLALMM